MIYLSEDEFRSLVSRAIDRIPEKFAKNLNNVGFVVEDQPTIEQLRRNHLHPNQTLFGLYEGIPLTKRGAGYNLVLPDKITIFKLPIEAACSDMKELENQVNNTVWHEVAHYFGLDHKMIKDLEAKHEG